MKKTIAGRKRNAEHILIFETGSFSYLNFKKNWKESKNLQRFYLILYSVSCNYWTS